MRTQTQIEYDNSWKLVSLNQTPTRLNFMRQNPNNINITSGKSIARFAYHTDEQWNKKVADFMDKYNLPTI
jgi:transketolase